MNQSRSPSHRGVLRHDSLDSLDRLVHGVGALTVPYETSVLCVFWFFLCPAPLVLAHKLRPPCLLHLCFVLPVDSGANVSSIRAVFGSLDTVNSFPLQRYSLFFDLFNHRPTLLVHCFLNVNVLTPLHAALILSVRNFFPSSICLIHFCLFRTRAACLLNSSFPSVRESHGSIWFITHGC